MDSENLRLGMVVNSPSPHQVLLLDAIADLVDLKVVYAFEGNPSRSWGRPHTKADFDILPNHVLWNPAKACSWVEQQERNFWIIASIYTAARTHLLSWAVKHLGLPQVYYGEPPRPRSGILRVVRDLLLA